MAAMPATLTPAQMALIVRQHKPRGWKIVATMRGHPEHRGLTYGPPDRIIKCQRVKDIETLATFLHECAHVHLGHFQTDQPPHVEEYEAERYAQHILAAWGIDSQPHKAYVARVIEEDRMNGLPINRRIARWTAPA